LQYSSLLSWFCCWFFLGFWAFRGTCCLRGSTATVVMNGTIH
jgi:hypothetical protein